MQHEIIKGIDIFDNRNSSFSNDRGVKINWGGRGSVSIAEAEQFVADMQECIKRAKEINN